MMGRFFDVVWYESINVVRALRSGTFLIQTEGRGRGLARVMLLFYQYIADKFGFDTSRTAEIRKPVIVLVRRIFLIWIRDQYNTHRFLGEYIRALIFAINHF